MSKALSLPLKKAHNLVKFPNKEQVRLVQGSKKGVGTKQA